MRKGIFFALIVVGLAALTGIIYLKAQDGSLSQNIIRVGVDGAFTPIEIVLSKDQQFNFKIFDMDNRQLAFLLVKSDVFIGKDTYLLSIVGEVAGGKYKLEVESLGKAIFEKQFEFKPTLLDKLDFSTQEKDLDFKRQLADGKMVIEVVTKKDMQLSVEDYIAQGLVASASAEMSSVIKNGLQSLRFDLEAKKGEINRIEYNLSGGKDSNIYSFGPAEIIEVISSKSAESERQSRKKIFSEPSLVWIHGKKLSWSEELVSGEKVIDENGWFHIGKLLIKNEGSRVLYRADSAGSEASYETDSQSDVDNVPLLLGKYKAFVTNGELLVYEQEDRQEEGSMKTKFKQIFP